MKRLYVGYAVVILLLLVAGIVTGYYALALLPLVGAVIALAVLDFKPLFWLLMAMIPLGAEVALPGGLGTDLPTEPLAVGLTGLFVLHAARYWPTYDYRAFLHPIAALIYVHVAWILVASGLSEVKVISLKFSLAKLWYVGAFFWLPLLIFRGPKRVKFFAHCVFWPLLFVALQTLVRHAGYGFSFSDQFRTMHPFMRNHVAYAGCLATFAPWLGYLIWSRWRAGRSYLPWLLGFGLIWLAAIYFSFTRAAYVSLVIAGVTYLAIRLRLLRFAVPLALAGGIAVAYYFVAGDRYLEYAPDFNNTISHEQFDDLISATYKLEDISTMERFHRWVAGGNMVPYRPVFGHGPGSFVELYQGYTNNNFLTYVSDNPERSGIHNYYLMTLVEQGYPGLLFLIALFVGAFLYGEQAYHRQNDPDARAAIAAALLSLTVVAAFCIINDVLETDKVGSLFFLNLAILIRMDRYLGGQLGPQQQDEPQRPYPDEQT